MHAQQCERLAEWNPEVERTCCCVFVLEDLKLSGAPPVFATGNVSGVIAVVVFGLYGSATGKWHMSPRVVESGSFDTFWDTVCFAFNSLVFFFAGASSINFFWRSSQVTAIHLSQVLDIPLNTSTIGNDRRCCFAATAL